MALFQLKWLRRLARNYMNPMPINKAELWKKRLSFAYMLIAWNAFGFVVYMVYSGKADWARYYGLKNEAQINMPPAQQWCQTLGVEKAKVYRFSGLHKQQEYLVEDGNIIRNSENDN